MKKFKKITTCGITALALAASVSAFASGETKLFANEKPITTDTAPIIENGTLYVPFRAVFEALGLEVSYDEPSNSVSAVKNSTWVYYEIGSNTISTDEGEFKISSPTKITGDRTMVPLELVYVGLGLKTVWDEDAKTVNISTQIGENIITEEKISKDIKSEDGTVVLKLEATYPVLENKANDENIKKVCEMLKTSAEKSIETTDDLIEIANETYKAQKEFGQEISPCVVSRSYKTTYDKNGIISFRYTDFSDFKGAHPITSVSSETYSLTAGKLLEFEDIFSEDAPEIIKNTFINQIDVSPEKFFEDAKTTVGAAEFKTDFYLKDGGAVFYFNVYEIAPYAAGLQTAEIVYTSRAFSDNFLKTVK